MCVWLWRCICLRVPVWVRGPAQVSLPGCSLRYYWDKVVYLELSFLACEPLGPTCLCPARRVPLQGGLELGSPRLCGSQFIHAIAPAPLGRLWWWPFGKDVIIEFCLLPEGMVQCAKMEEYVGSVPAVPWRPWLAKVSVHLEIRWSVGNRCDSPFGVILLPIWLWKMKLLCSV